jgi:hypothetical protein
MYILENASVKAQLAEAQSLQKSIRDMELELARIKAKHPPENVKSPRFIQPAWIHDS